jgi:hypothetical protein
MCTFILRSVWSFTDRLAAIVALLCVFFMLLHDKLGRIEGKVWPVARNSNLVVTPDGGNTAITGDVIVLRPSCSFSKIEWFWLSKGESLKFPSPSQKAQLFSQVAHSRKPDRRCTIGVRGALGLS